MRGCSSAGLERWTHNPLVTGSSPVIPTPNAALGKSGIGSERNMGGMSFQLQSGYPLTTRSKWHRQVPNAKLVRGYGDFHT